MEELILLRLSGDASVVESFDSDTSLDLEVRVAHFWGDAPTSSERNT